MGLTKTEIAQAITNATGIRPNLVKNVLDQLASVAAEQVSQGEDFTVPGICKVQYRYTKPLKKGESYKKGDERYNRFTDETTIAEADSPARKAKIRLVAVPTGKVGQLKPGQKPEVQAEFLKTKTAKAVVRSKG